MAPLYVLVGGIALAALLWVLFFAFLRWREARIHK